ncbi:MAG: chemotaxis protein CheB [Oligoflexales bacterium]
MNGLQISNFTEKEKKEIFELVSGIAGTNKVALDKPDIFLNNVQRRMYANNIIHLKDYINFAQKNSVEFGHLVSSLTIHTTYWFRESKHFVSLEQVLTKMGRNRRLVKVLSMGCSSGEEVYSIGLVLEHYRNMFPAFDYHIDGYDIDPVSIKRAKKAIYSKSSLSRIPEKYHAFVMLGSGETEGLMTVSSHIRSRCNFKVGSAVNFSQLTDTVYQIIFCRNMLIYFNDREIDQVIRGFVARSDDNAFLYIGHSEDISQFSHGLNRASGSLYRKRIRLHDKKSSKNENDLKTPKVKKDVLIVDDSRTIRATVDAIIGEEGLSCLSTSTALEASEALEHYEFKLIILDLKLPDERGDQWLMAKRKAGCSIPCIIITGAGKNERNEVLGVLGKAAQDLFMKSSLTDERDKFKERINSFVHSNELFYYAPKTPVVFIDDEEEILNIFSEIIKARGFEIKTFSDPLEALEFLKNNPAHCVFLDHSMPRMTGEKLYWELGKYSRGEPLILMSGDPEAKNLAYTKHVFRVLDKPIDTHSLVNAINDATYEKYMGALRKFDKKNLIQPSLVIVGASTGGPQAVAQVLNNLGESFPPIIVVQHIQKDFQESFGTNLAANTGLSVEAVTDKQILKPNMVYLSAPDKHIFVNSKNGNLYARLDQRPVYKGHRPCIDHLFMSAAKVAVDLNVMAVLLTGMGDDGAKGLLNLKEQGAYTVAQSYKSSTVFGMPRVAIDLGAAVCIADLIEINQMLQIISDK